MPKTIVSVLIVYVSICGGAAFGDQDGIDYETARFDRRLVAERSNQAIVVDGFLDEIDWRDAPIATNFIQNDPREGEPATYETETRVLYDDDNIYLGVIAHDDEPERIIVNDLTRDFSARSGDAFGVVLSGFPRRAVRFR